MYEAGDDNWLKIPILPGRLCQEMLAIGVVSTAGSDGHFRVEERPKEVSDDQIQTIIDAHDPTPGPPPVDPMVQKLADLQEKVDKLQAAVSSAVPAVKSAMEDMKS